MNRGKEIELAANAAIDGLCGLEGFDKTDMCNMFASGVTWADAHPKRLGDGCKFCGKEEEVTSDECKECKLSYSNYKLYAEADIPYNGVLCSFNINFCPMCGRKLK